MSGSTICQNGEILGTVTHVLVNDSTRGMGYLLEICWMRQNSAMNEQRLQALSKDILFFKTVGVCLDNVIMEK